MYVRSPPIEVFFEELEFPFLHDCGNKHAHRETCF